MNLLRTTLSLSLSLSMLAAAGCKKDEAAPPAPAAKATPAAPAAPATGAPAAAAPAPAAAAPAELPGSVETGKVDDIGFELKVPPGFTRDAKLTYKWEKKAEPGIEYTLMVFDGDPFPKDEKDALGWSGRSAATKKMRSEQSADSFLLVTEDAENAADIGEVGVVLWVKSGTSWLRCQGEAVGRYGNDDLLKAAKIDWAKEVATLTSYCRTVVKK